MKLRDPRTGETRDVAPGALPAGAFAVRDGNAAWVAWRGETWRIVPAATRRAGFPEEEHALTAPMPGRILAVKVTDGARVEKGDILVVLEAMKMEHAVKSPKSGVVSHLAAEPGKMVGLGDVLLDVT